jgi:hypothetical protein
MKLILKIKPNKSAKKKENYCVDTKKFRIQ